MLDNVKKTIVKHNMIVKKDKILLAVSGGPDSVAMVYALLNIKEEYLLDLHIFHLNHKLRVQEADKDAEFVKDLGHKLNIPVTIEEFKVAEYIEKEKLSLQEGAREIRYSLLEKKAQEIGATKISLGQNANDQVETILMRFLRGAGINGLAGIVPVREKKYIRPLIETWREEIESFLTENNIETRLDSSNLKPVYLRNKVRLELLPLIRDKYNPNLDQIIFKMGEVFREENAFLEEKTVKRLKEILINEESGRMTISKNSFLKTPIVLQRRILKALWARVRGKAKGLGHVHIEGAIDFVLKGSVGGRLNLPRGIILRLDYDTFILEDSNHILVDNIETKTLECFSIKVPGKTRISEEMTIQTEIIRNSGELKATKNNFDSEVYLDCDLIPEQLFYRNRRPGDLFSPLNGRGRKKLKDYFIDMKIPRDNRDKIGLIANNNVIFWVVGYSINDRFKVSSGTKNILRIKLDKN